MTDRCPSDLAAVDALVATEEERFLARMPKSRALLAEARGSLVGGVSSNWQSAPPQAVWVTHGKGRTSSTPTAPSTWTCTPASA